MSVDAERESSLVGGSANFNQEINLPETDVKFVSGPPPPLSIPRKKGADLGSEERISLPGNKEMTRMMGEHRQDDNIATLTNVHPSPLSETSNSKPQDLEDSNNGDDGHQDEDSSSLNHDLVGIKLREGLVENEPFSNKTEGCRD